MGDIIFVLYYHHERVGSTNDNDDLYDPLKTEEENQIARGFEK